MAVLVAYVRWSVSWESSCVESMGTKVMADWHSFLQFRGAKGSRDSYSRVINHMGEYGHIMYRLKGNLVRVSQCFAR
jgi:hypothetical protein